MFTTFTPPAAGPDLTAGLRAMSLCASMQVHSTAFLAHLKVAGGAPDDASAFAAIEAARAELAALEQEWPQFRDAARRYMQSDPNAARDLTPLLAEDGQIDGFVAALAEAEQLIRAARLGRRPVGSA